MGGPATVRTVLPPFRVARGSAPPRARYLEILQLRIGDVEPWGDGDGVTAEVDLRDVHQKFPGLDVDLAGALRRSDDQVHDGSP